MKAVVIGAGGHVGLPLAVLMSCANSKIESVYGIELKQELCDELNKPDAIPPFYEKSLEAGLRWSTKNNRLKFGLWSDDEIAKADTIIVIIGTPVDEENNPRLEPLFAIADKLAQLDLNGKTIILRSTVAPGTTEIFESRLDKVKFDSYNLAFCPERVTQGNSIAEIVSLPQIVGMRAGSFDKVQEFFQAFIDVELIECTAREAEIGKLFTNMARYVEFAVANEFQMLADSFDVDGANVLEMFKKDYPRLNIARPGPNVGGPCLFKDGRFLLKNTIGGTIIEEAFRVNEGMPAFIVRKIREAPGFVGFDVFPNILIMGAAFKAESDDIRNSLSFKLKKLLVNEGANVDMYDPFISGIHAVPDWKEYDVFVVMTPHSYFKKNLSYLDKFKDVRQNAILVDLWKLHNKNNIIERMSKR